MFKLESYVTPIILNHVAKYVKDIKPEDAQVSLWEGEVSFQNLELRLNVLEDELNLPIELKTGHIHDLTIQVPWTRINSEPIKIIINTIEFVVKLRKDDGSPMPLRQKVEQKKDENEQQQPSMIMGLVNKIINNINVEFQNIIFKFLDEEFVVSMNIQKLMLSAANEEWQPAMVDISPIKIVLRKLVQLKDLTICLDQLNEAGEIDVCHEPILYRCSLECRFLRKYNVTSAKTTSTTRVGVLTKSMSLLLSTLQFPLALKIVDLISDITKGKIKIKKLYKEETVEGSETEDGGASYLSWAWNLLPSLNFSYSSKDEEDDNNQEGHVFDIGVYLEAFNLTFKNSEYVHDAIVGGIKRIRYHPIMKISFGGLYFEQQTNAERQWFSMKTGVSHFCIEPLGVCKSDKACTNILEGNIGPKNSFKDMSLFDTRLQLSDKYWAFANLEEYNSRISDKYLLSRSPILAFDVVQTIDNNGSICQVLSSIDTASNTGPPKQVQFRVLSSGMTFRYNQHLQQVNHIITDLLNNYKFSAYHADKIDAAGQTSHFKESSSSTTTTSATTSAASSSTRTLEDVEAIINKLPKTSYIIRLENLKIEFHTQTEPLYDYSKGWTPNQQSILTSSERDKLPYFTFHIKHVKGTCTKLTDTTFLSELLSQCKETPISLLEASYKNYDFTLSDTTLRIQYPEKLKGEKLAFMPLFEINYASLMEPHLWKDEYTAFNKMFIKCPYLNISFFKRQLVQCFRLLNHIGVYKPNTLLPFSKQNERKFVPEEQLYLRTIFNDINITKLVFKEHLIWYMSLKSLKGNLWDGKTKETHHIFKSNNEQEKMQWLEAQVQQPLVEEPSNQADSIPNYAFGLWVREYHMQIDEKLLEFLEYRDEFEYISEEVIPRENEVKVVHYQPPSSSNNTAQNFGTASNISLSQQHSSTSNRRFSRANSNPRKFSYPEETIHYSSERDEIIPDDSQCAKTQLVSPINPPDVVATYIHWLKILKRSVFNIELDCWEIDVANELKLLNECGRATDYVKLRLKKITARSDTYYQIQCGDLTKKLSSASLEKNDFNAHISFNHFSVRCQESNKTDIILDDLNVTFSIYFEHKVIKFPVYFADLASVTSEQKIGDNESDYFIEEQEEEFEEQNDEVSETDSEAVVKNDSKILKSKKQFKLKDIFPRDTLLHRPALRKSKTRNELSVNVHMNVPLIHLYLKKLKEVHRSLNLLICFHESLSCIPINTHKVSSLSDPVQIVTASEKNAALDEFLQLDLRLDTLNCQASTNIEVDNKFHHRLKVSLFGQCSIEKVLIELDDCVKRPRTTLLFCLEDILSTLDVHHHYLKCTAKFGNLEMNLLPIKLPNDSNLDCTLRLKMINNENDNFSMGNIVYTAVDMDTLYDKLEIKIKNSKIKQEGSMKEIIINFKEIELIVQLETLNKFLLPTSPLYDLIEMNHKSQSKVQQESRTLSVSDLPIVHLECQGFSCFFILLHQEPSCNLALFKVERIKVSPYLKNPLERNALRPDIFRKASLLGLVGVPGSIIENRQYELSFINMSAFTGSWIDIQHYMQSASKSLNPALEWNNEMQDNNVLPLRKMFGDFSVICTYAPCIVYKNILICGDAMEFNCATDFIIYINTTQLSLLNAILDNMKTIKSIFSKSSSTNSSLMSPVTSLKEFTTIKTINGNDSNFTIYEDCKESSTFAILNETTSDSGYSSKMPKIVTSNSSDIRKVSNVLSYQLEQPKRKMPYFFSLIAGKFIFHFFHLSKQKTGLTENSLPLMSIGFSEPSFMLNQNVFDYSIQISLFDLVLSIANLHTKEFSQELLMTAPGKPNSSGIPSPLFTYRSTVTKQKLSEVEIEISKAIIFNHYEAYVTRFFDNFLILQKALSSSYLSKERPIQPVLKGSKIQLMKSRLLSADRLHVACQRLEFNFSDEKLYKCRLVVADIGANAKFFQRPEKASIKASIGSFYLQTDQQIFVHPVALKFSSNFIREPWNRLPLILATFKFNVVHIDLSMDLLTQFQDSLKGIRSVSEYCNKGYENFLKERPQFEENKLDKNHLNLLKVDKFEPDLKKKKSKPIDIKEFYQDDLRAGAFQFVEMFSDKVLPLPYQIHIIKKDFGIICWRYPQPRQMCKIQVFPVPMESENSVQIKCRMEYYSDLFNRFMYYCDFCLTQNDTSEVTLPDHEVCATIWRVVIMQSLVAVNCECFKMEDEDDELKSIPSYKMDASFNAIPNEKDFALHPKVLVACLRIDTTFQPRHIPKVQILVSCNIIQAKVLNEPNGRYDIPTDLQGLRPKNKPSTYQNILEIFIENFDFCSTFFSLKFYTLDSCLTARVKTLDLGFLNMLPILEPAKMQFYAAIDKQTCSSILNCIIEKLYINLGPSVLQTLMTTNKYIQGFLNPLDAVEESISSKCIIVNNTDVKLLFGQTGTNEMIDLAPNSFHFYHFLSEKFGQELTFSAIEDPNEPAELSKSVPIPFKFDSETVYKSVKIGNRCLSIRIKKLNNAQVIVDVKGQIEILSMVSHDLLVQFRYDEDKNNLHKDFVVFQKAKQSFLLSVQRTTNINLRLKIMGAVGKGRTGDIPLRVTKNLPWLVKIPVEKKDFISVWVRVLREDVDCIQDSDSASFFPQKILVIIWPVFQIENFLNSSIEIVESSSNNRYSIQGKRSAKVLDVAATNISEHNVEIDYSGSVNTQDPTTYTLMLKALDWHQLFQYDEEEWSIENAIQLLSQEESRKWPMDNSEEIRINRNSQNNVPANISLKCNLSNEFACSMSLLVKPWGLFINASGLDVSIRDTATNERQHVLSNYVEMMTSIKKTFTIDVQRGSEWYSSIDIDYLEITKHQTLQKDRSNKVKSFITELTLILQDVVVRFVLLFAYENDYRIFKLSSKYVVTNYLKESLCLIPFAMDHKENCNRDELINFDKKVPKFHIKSSNDNCRIGLTLDAFFDIKATKTRRTKDAAFVYFICLKHFDNSEISIPISLATPFSRRCISIQSGSESIPIIISLLEKDSIYYLNIARDISPTFLIYNRTDVALITAQTTASENSQVTNTTAEYEGRQFEWFHVVQPLSRSYYTPPDLSYGFTNTDTILCNLSLALFKENVNKKSIKWSKPIRTDKTWQKFLHLPGHGDIKVLICDKHRVTRVSIFYVSEQSEFSVKDLRSRIVTRNLQQDSQLTIINPDGEDGVPSKNYSSNTKEDQEDDLNDLECKHFRNDLVQKTKWKMKIYAKELRLTMHTEDKDRDCIKQEIISLHIDDMAIAYDENTDDREVNVVMTNVQVDNQMYSLGKYDFPVILCAQRLYERQSKIVHFHDLKKLYQNLFENQPMFHFKLKFYSDELVLHSVLCKISPLRIYIEDSFVNDFLEALVEYSQLTIYNKSDKTDKVKVELSPGESLVPETIISQVVCISEPMKLRHFVIESLNVLLSVHTSVRLYIALDHSPLSFAKYERQNILTMPIRFGQSLGLHYLSGAIFGAGWVVGSLEILGSPSGLARSVTTGLKDFVSMPVEGLFRGPWGFLIGITQGSASLFRNITAGTVNSVTKLASSVARNLDRLSLDKEHIERTEALRRLRPQGLTEGISQGLTGFGISLLGAVGGIAHHTLEAHTAVQVLTGISKGIVGVITKPLSGAAELLALTGQGMLHTVGFNAMPQPISPNVANNMSAEPAAYRIWKLLPSELISDQVLIYNEVTLLRNGQMKKAYIFLTLSIFAIIESDWDKLALALQVSKVDMRFDPADKTLIYVRIVKEPQDDMEERNNFTNERIMNFLQSSEHSMTPTTLQEILRFHQENSFAQSDDWAFYIDINLGEHLIQYINIMKADNRD